jgi:threonine dehydrogenase-like Zn-dependent dehydrogenase
VKAFVISAPGSVGVVDRPDPLPGPGEVLVRVGVATICHTDMYLLSGRHQSATYPVVPGHEFSGTICETGQGVDPGRIGQRVAVQTLLGCGWCTECQRGNPGFCPSLREFGSLSDGGWEELVSMPGYAARPFEGDLSLAGAALTEPSANAHAIVRSAGIGYTDIVAVIGPGAIGLLTMQYARLWHPRRTIVVGTRKDARRLEAARALGADDVLACSTTEEALEAVLTLTGGHGADAVLQCAGSLEATRLAIGIVATNGRVAIEGVVGGWDEIGVSPDRLVAKQCVVRGVRGWTVPDFCAALEYNSRGLVELGPIITHHFPLQSHQEALRLAFDGGEAAIKVAFDLAVPS